MYKDPKWNQFQKQRLIFPFSFKFASYFARKGCLTYCGFSGHVSVGLILRLASASSLFLSPKFHMTWEKRRKRGGQILPRKPGTPSLCRLPCKDNWSLLLWPSRCQEYQRRCKANIFPNWTKKQEELGFKRGKERCLVNFIQASNSFKSVWNIRRKFSIRCSHPMLL